MRFKILSYLPFVCVILYYLPSIFYLQDNEPVTAIHSIPMIQEQQLNVPGIPTKKGTRVSIQKGTKTFIGPTLPEVQKFTPHEITELVDPFTGNFGYSIPLVDIEGYPLTLSYNSDVKPEDEASNVGLGWNLNIGQITRNMRGLPDDFNGEMVKKDLNIKSRENVGGNLNASLELFGFDPQFGFSIGANANIEFNNYSGLSLGYGTNLGLKVNMTNKNQTADAYSFTPSVNVGMQVSTSGPPNFTGSAGLDYSNVQTTHKTTFGGNIGTAYNSIEGIKAVNFSMSLNASKPNGGYQLENLSLAKSFNLSFAKPTPIPPTQFPMLSTAYSSRIGVSGEISGLAPGASIEVFKQIESLLYKSENLPAYGYFYLHQQQGSLQRALLDFNREKDGAYIKNAPVLPIAFSSFDIFTVSGQGLTGQFRPYRTDMGTFHDPVCADGSFSLNVGAQVKAGNIAGIGLDATGGASGNVISKWEVSNDLLETFSFQKPNNADTALHIYFRDIGDLGVLQNEDLLMNKLGGFQPVKASLQQQSISNTTLINQNGQATNAGSSSLRKIKREPVRNTFSILTAKEAEAVAQQTKISNFIENQVSNTLENRINGYRSKDHISDITIIRNDGVAYNFGIPAYNIRYKEVSFSTESGIGSNQQLVKYSTTDNSIGNLKGQNNHFASTELPPYAYAYLLTSIVSPDYVDISNNGPSVDDFGSYTLFNYSRIYEDFKWRTPYAKDSANFSPGNYSDTKDDNGNYVYGEKEIWSIHSIESKNMVARFFTETRDDALEVTNENGGIASNARSLRKIRFIKLYSKSELLKNGLQTRPLKTIEFVYDYELCKGAPGSKNNKGKLTLRKLLMYYYNSEKGKLSPYIFSYYGENKTYNSGCYDRWGSYKESNQNNLNSRDFPYTFQRSVNNNEIQTWNLRSVILPTGSKVNVEYESDDYGFVQDKRAMEMLPIVGFHNNPSNGSALTTSLYKTLNIAAISSGNVTDIINNVNEYIVFRLKKPIKGNEQIVIHEYLKGIEEMYFSFRIKLLAGNQPFEKIEGFIPIGRINVADSGLLYGIFSENGIAAGSTYELAYVKLSYLQSNNHLRIHPATWIAWQKAKTMLPLMYAGNMPPSAEPDAFLSWLTSKFSSQEAITDFLSLFIGFYDKLFLEERGSLVDINTSFIRLNSYDYKKMGGGLRVKRITIDDNWGKMQAATQPSLNFTYGQTYEYSTIEGNLKISSGVAAYEPMIGNEENSIVQQEKYSVTNIFAPADMLNCMKPYGESFYPSAQVGYSKIKISNIHRGEKLKKNGPGFSIHEYYTAKDFPTVEKHTEKSRQQFYLEPVNPLVDIITHSATQGYYIEVNNMHGKPKAIHQFSETDTSKPFKSTKYFYKTNPFLSNELNNEALVAHDGRIENKIIGLDYDVIADGRHIVNAAGALDLQLNVDYFQAGPVPIVIPVPIPWPSFSFHELKTHTITKTVQRCGILDSVQEFNNGSLTTIENILYDGNTGEVLITKHSDEFGDYYYTTHIPAYWVYGNMGPAYENTGFVDNSISIDGEGIASTRHARSKFKTGDRLLVGSNNAWVLQVANEEVKIIDESGQPFPAGTYEVKVIRSGNKNMTALGSGKVVTKNNPIVQEGNQSRLQFTNVIDAHATEYKERWQTYQGMKIHYPAQICSCTPDNEKINWIQAILDSINQSNNACNIKTYSLSKPGLNCSATVFPEEDGLTIRLHGNDCNKQDCEIYLKDSSWNFKESCRFKFQGLTLDLASTCNQTNSFTVKTSKNPVTGLEHIFKGRSSCFKLNECHTKQQGVAFTDCNINNGALVNPFLAGTANNWKQSAAYLYFSNRNYNSVTVKNQGYYESFVPFWDINRYGVGTLNSPIKEQWTRTDSVTLIDPFGNVLESKNVLGIASSNLYGYGFSLLTATAQNTLHTNIASENFEDYAYKNRSGQEGGDLCILPPHWKFNIRNSLSDKESHTGRYSLIATKDTILSLRMPVLNCTGEPNRYEACNLIRNFSPSTNKYVISAWIKATRCVIPLIGGRPQAEVCNTLLPAESNLISLKLFRKENNGQTEILSILKPEGNMIDGWQLYKGEFNIANELYSLIGFSIDANSYYIGEVSQQVYVDDIRIHPFNANMETFVYDPFTLRLLSKLDQNNYAIFYDYDMEGELVRIRKETERGIKTIQESRTAKPKSTQLNIQ